MGRPWKLAGDALLRWVRALAGWFVETGQRALWYGQYTNWSIDRNDRGKLCRRTERSGTGQAINFSYQQLPAASIYHHAIVQKGRWSIELFSKWIKQHLRIKSFFGTSENAVKTQIWIAVSIHLLVAIMKKRLHLDMKLYTILQILSVVLFEKAPLLQVLTKTTYKCITNDSHNQLLLFDL